MNTTIAKIILDIKAEIFNRFERIKLLRKYEKQILSFQRMLAENTESGIDEIQIRNSYDSWSKRIFVRFMIRYSWFCQLGLQEQDALENAILDWCSWNKMAPTQLVSSSCVSIEMRQQVGKPQLWFVVDIGKNIPDGYVTETHYVHPEPYTYTEVRCSKK